ncbi:MBL fold metallo-hydrolase [Chitinophaga qingshengii]|uniref:MBL fold metallo-hydrolase n=1 Tax=Chitinophaga qingshengii TaxID=1569794 RepID=A0ABR7TL26_9BACT|nr:MBL fold metallo-hydrolase [Chitinophaga qingshengii]MBC9930119.1 MBL fold metallo-hydrolase [Chitinophaga qingshengii]
MQIQHFRHATIVIELEGRKILVDPMLSHKDALDTVPNAANTRRNPLIDFPLNDMELATLLSTMDAVIVTHLHRDHWDVAAQQLVPKHLPLFCQPEDIATLTAQGFSQLIPVNTTTTWEGIRISRTGGQHGTGEIGKLMAPVSGFVLEAGAERIYIAGDTIWCDEVKAALDQYQPTHTVVNAGAAQFLTGDPITMTASDVLQVLQHPSNTRVIAVHMEAINHCYLTKEGLKTALGDGFGERLQIP